MVFSDTLRNNKEREYLNTNLEKYLPIYFSYERETPKSREITEAFRSHYFQNKSLKYPESLNSFLSMYIDGTICFNFRFLQMVSKYTPVYTYIFTYKGRYSHFVNPDTNQTLGNWLTEILYY